MGGLLSFLGGSFFRMLWGEISAVWSKAQEHKHELERMEAQEKLDAAAHARQMDMIRLQHEQGIEVVHVQGELDLEKLAAVTFDKAVEGTYRATGIKFVDLWKGVIQPALATEMMILIGLYYSRHNWEMDARGWELAGAVLGVFVADRLLFRRGK